MALESNFKFKNQFAVNPTIPFIHLGRFQLVEVLNTSSSKPMNKTIQGTINYENIHLK